jgi:AraC family transcriptional regulator
MEAVLGLGRHIGAMRFEAAVEGFSLGFWFARAAGNPVEPHGHNDAHLMYAFGGAYATTAHGEPGRHPGQLICNPPQTFHADQFEAAGAFLSVGVGSAVWEAAHGRPARPSHLQALRPRMAAARIISELAAWDEASAFTCEVLCHEMLSSALAPAPMERFRPPWLDEACDLLRAAHAGPTRLGDIASAAGVHPHHLTRTFRAFEGCTPGEYRLSVRLEAAQRMLSRGAASLAETALAAGFSDQSQFTRRFRAAYGLTPGEYRRRVHG